MSPCPKCKRVPDARDVVAELGMARCSACGETWSEAVAKDPPAGVTVRDLGDRLVIGAHTREAGTFIELGFMLLWTALSSLFVVIGFATWFVPFLAISVLFVCIGVVRIVLAVRKVFGHHRIEVGGGFLRVFVGPPDRETLALAFADIELIEIEGGGLISAVVARTRDRRRITLATSASFEGAAFVADAVRARLAR